MSAQLVSVTPESFTCDVVLDCDVVTELQLKNLTTSNVAFKIKTTAPQLYQVNPITGVLPPSSMVPVIIMLKRLSRYPDRNNPKEIKHKFLVQTAIYDTADVSLADFWAAKEAQHKPKEGNPAYLDSRVNCQLIIPDTNAPAAADTAALAANTDDASTLRSLLEERRQEYQGLMDYSITQSTNIRQLEAKVTQLESERASLLTSQDALTARIESLRARVAEHDQEREAAAKARSDAALSSGKPLTPAERLTAPVSIVAWQAIAAVVGAFVIGAVLF